MLARYLGIAFMTLLAGLWLASGVYGFVLLSETKDKAQSVQSGTQTVRDALVVAEVDDAARRGFPEGEIARALQGIWAANVNIAQFPRGLSAEYSVTAERARASR